MCRHPTLRSLAAAALLVVFACGSEVRVADESVVHVWKSPRHEGSSLASYDAKAERIVFDVELPKPFARDAMIQVEVTNQGSDPVFVRTIDGTRMFLYSEMKLPNGFFPSGGNRAYNQEGTKLVRLDPGQSIRGSIRIDELPPITGTTSPSGVNWLGENESVEGEFRLAGTFHSRSHAATEKPADCDERQLASPSFVVPHTAWKR